MTQDIRKTMRHDLSDRSLFEMSQTAAHDYAESINLRNVYPTEEALASLSDFDESLPQQSCDAKIIVDQLHEIGSPATIAQIGGRYYGLVNGGVVPAALAAKWLTDFWDQNCPLYFSSPITSKLESITENWLRQLLGLPERTVAGFVSGSSLAIFAALAAARFRIFDNQGWDINQKGFHGAPKIRLIASRQAHATVFKAIALLGFGLDNIEWVDADDQGCIRPDKIPPLCNVSILLLQAGNVNSGGFDQFRPICENARQAGAWVHIDGAFGLWAAGSTTLSGLVDGIELANSWSMDAHKTLNAPYDNGIVLCEDKDALVKALQATGAYITYGENRDGMLYTPEMSRRSRAIELWVTMKYLGRDGIDQLVTGLHQRARQAAKQLSEAGFHILNDVCFNQVLISCDTEAKTQSVLENVQEEGVCWVGGSQWQNKSVIRLSVCSWATTEDDINQSVESFIRALDAV